MLGREVSSLAFCSADGEAASGCTEGKRVELPDCSTAVIVGDGESASRVTGLGVRPRPMDLQRLLHLVRDGGCLLRFLSEQLAIRNPPINKKETCQEKI